MPTPQHFRTAFPLFTQDLFPDGRVSFYLTLAQKQTARERWGDMWQEGCFLYAAHFLTLERAAMKAEDGTGGMGAAAGAVISASKSVGGVSKSETRAGAAATGNVNAGHWNDTIFGKQYWQLAQLMGAGGVQL